MFVLVSDNTIGVKFIYSRGPVGWTWLLRETRNSWVRDLCLFGGFSLLIWWSWANVCSKFSVPAALDVFSPLDLQVCSLTRPAFQTLTTAFVVVQHPRWVEVELKFYFFNWVFAAWAGGFVSEGVRVCTVRSFVVLFSGPLFAHLTWYRWSSVGDLFV